MSKTGRGTALVTGASTGIGLATARALRDAGYIRLLRRYVPEIAFDKSLRKQMGLPA